VARTKETGSKELPTTGLNLDFRTSPMVYNFLQSDAFVRGLMGPVGSGKSTLARLRSCCVPSGKSPHL
jgi:pantothenate kinase-related protein Tda10